MGLKPVFIGFENFFGNPSVSVALVYFYFTTQGKESKVYFLALWRTFDGTDSKPLLIHHIDVYIMDQSTLLKIYLIHILLMIEDT